MRLSKAERRRSQKHARQCAEALISKLKEQVKVLEAEATSLRAQLAACDCTEDRIQCVRPVLAALDDNQPVSHVTRLRRNVAAHAPRSLLCGAK
eukprot:8058714-Karenia_brevis.AAC.1